MSETERSSIYSRVRIVLNATDKEGRQAEPWAYGALRVWLGLTLLTHGVPKLLHLPHGGSSDAYANLVDEIGGKLHLPFAAALAMMVTLTETLGAAALVLGLATRLAALAIVIDLLVAVFGVHLPRWDWTEGGAEYPLLMATVAAFITCAAADRTRWMRDSLPFLIGLRPPSLRPSNVASRATAITGTTSFRQWVEEDFSWFSPLIAEWTSATRLFPIGNGGREGIGVLRIDGMIEKRLICHYTGPMPTSTTINPDDFLDTAEGRVWTAERNEEAWRLSYAALEHVIAASSAPMRVVVVCGVQGAGKSTWIASQPVSPSTIYFDAALPAARHREKVISIAKGLAAAVEAVWIDTPLDVAIERNAARTPDKMVPVTSIVAVAKQFEEPTAAEGFDRVAVYKGG